MSNIITIHDKKASKNLLMTNGLAVLNNCISCYAEEKLNNTYELTLEYPIDTDTTNKCQYLEVGNIIKASNQYFRIYYINKTLTSISINARHIFYDLLDNFIEDWTVYSSDCDTILVSLLEHTQYTNDFINSCDAIQIPSTQTATFTAKEVNPVQALMGDGGLLSVFNADIIRNNYSISIVPSRGSKNGVLISYGKNIVGIEETIDNTNLCTRIYAKHNDLHTIADSQYIDDFEHPYIKTIEFNDESITNAAQLNTVAQNYFLTSKCDFPIINYKIDFIELSKTEEYKNYTSLNNVNMGDTVIIRHKKLNIDIECRVIRIKRNVLTDRIEEIELGNFLKTIAQTINNVEGKVSSSGQTVDLVAGNVSVVDTANNFTSKNVEGALAELFTCASNGKKLIVDALVKKWVQASYNDSFALLAKDIDNLLTIPIVFVSEIYTGISLTTPTISIDTITDSVSVSTETPIPSTISETYSGITIDTSNININIDTITENVTITKS